MAPEGQNENVNTLHFPTAQENEITNDQDFDNITENGLDWFHSLNGDQLPSSPKNMNSPSITSTRQQHNKTGQATRLTLTVAAQSQLENNNQCEQSLCRPSSSSTRNNVFLSNQSPCATTKTTSKESTSKETEGHCCDSETFNERRRCKTREATEATASAGPEESVFQRVSKKLRNKRLKELEGSRGKVTEEGRGTVVENKSGKLCYVTDSEQMLPSNALLDLQVSSAAGSGKKRSLTNNVLQDTGLSGIPGIPDRNEPINMMAAGSKEKVTTRVKVRAEHKNEINVDLHSKLSGFTFNPKAKMSLVRPLSNNPHTEVSSSLNTVTQMHPDPDLTQFHTNGQKVHLGNDQVNSPDSPAPLIIKTLGNPLEGGNRGTRAKKAGFSSESETCHQRIVAGTETNLDIFNDALSLTSTNHLSHPVLPQKSERLSSTVASTTLSKLSSFSFCSKEPKPKTLSSTDMQQAANSVRATDTQSKLQTLIEQSAVGTAVESINTELQNNKVNLAESHIDVKSGARLMAHIGGETAAPTGTSKKRKCFELGPSPSKAGPSSRGTVSSLSLFSSRDFCDHDLDFDWDQETAKS